MKTVTNYLTNIFKKITFKGSNDYWVARYKKGLNSGWGSYEKLAFFKAEVLNNFIAEKNIKTMIEYGCGDGNQLKLLKINSYLGFDVSPDALNLCRKEFNSDASKKFKLVADYANEKAELCVSLDVIYHLVEDSVFENYMKRLFSSAEKYVIIYSSNTDENVEFCPPHVRNRTFTPWVEKNVSQFKLIKHIPNIYPFNGTEREGSHADFFIYEKIK